MIRCDSFGRAIVFSVLAAAGWIPWVMLTGPVAGVWSARTLYLIVVLTLYAAGLAAAHASRWRVPVAAGVAAGSLALIAGSTAELVIGLAVVLGVARSGFLYPTAPSRAIVREAVLLLGGLVLARALATASLASTGLALWGFLLVQSFFFLLPRAAATRAAADPFEEAHRRALAILERTGG